MFRAATLVPCRPLERLRQFFLQGGSHVLPRQDDSTVPYPAGMEERDVFLKRNSCGATTVLAGSNGCVEYQGCDGGKPVLWCGTETGGHWYPNFSAQESKTFFDRFK